MVYLIAAMLLGGAAALAVAYAVILGNATDVEDQTVMSNVERAEHAFEMRLDRLGSVVGDWAPWDDSYEFVLTGNEEYVDSNLDASTLDNLGIDAFVYYDADDEIVFEATYDAETEELTQLPGADEIPERLDCQFEGDEDDECSALLAMPDGQVLMVSALPVLTSEYEGPPAGTLVAARYIDERMVAEISESTDLAVTATAIEASDLSAGEVVIEEEGPNEITGTSVLLGVEGDPVLQIDVMSDRVARNAAEDAVVIFATGLVAVFVVATIVLIVVMNHSVLDRITSLSRQVRKVQTEGPSEDIEVEGGDEITVLADDVNDMVLALEESRQSLEEARDGLEETVQERTGELQTAVVSLQGEVEQRIAAEKALGASEAQHRALVENLVDVLLILDTDGVVTYANPATKVALGYLPDQIVGKHITEVLSAESADEVRATLERGRAAGSFSELELFVVGSQGTQLIMECCVTDLDRNGEMQVILRDVTLRKHYEDELVYLAGHDHLTGLFNRRRFEEELERALAEARRRDTHGALLWFDLDQFKEVNDILGHHVGDEMLVQIANSLEREVRDESTLSRLGGDEFAVLLPMADAVEARHAADRILAEIGRTVFDAGERTLRITASLGIVLYPDHGTTVDELLSHADIAMYRAKETGRARWTIYSPTEDWHDEVEHRATWAQRIQKALDADELIAFAQPIHDLATDEINLFELLVRMKDEDGTIIPPDRFLSAAERVGLIRDIDVWMLRYAIDLLKTYEEQNLYINVNVSPRSLADGVYLDTAREALIEAGIEPRRLGLEITETAIVSDMGRVNDAVRVIKQIGCRLVLDDFGSGFSSFFYLKQMALDSIKIDGSYVRHLCQSSQDQHLVRAIVEMARGLGMLTTAEYVESEDIMDQLRTLGVDLAQGYAIGRPSAASELIADHIKARSETA
jgi:diguanylate cyclase (GGDEF)-like protein/PAS domain S-box-containing protein